MQSEYPRDKKTKHCSLKASSVLTQEDITLYVGVTIPFIAVVVHYPHLTHISTEGLYSLRCINVVWLNKNPCSVVIYFRLALDLNQTGGHFVILLFFSFLLMTTMFQKPQLCSI